MGKPYFMVHKRNGFGPALQHSTYDRAMREAERLARLEPGSSFVVLGTIKEVRIPEILYEDCRAESPFAL